MVDPHLLSIKWQNEIDWLKPLTWCLLGRRTVEASSEPDGFQANACSSLEKRCEIYKMDKALTQSLVTCNCDLKAGFDYWIGNKLRHGLEVTRSRISWRLRLRTVPWIITLQIRWSHCWPLKRQVICSCLPNSPWHIFRCWLQDSLAAENSDPPNLNTFLSFTDVWYGKMLTIFFPNDSKKSQWINVIFRT